MTDQAKTTVRQGCPEIEVEPGSPVSVVAGGALHQVISTITVKTEARREDRFQRVKLAVANRIVGNGYGVVV